MQSSQDDAPAAAATAADDSGDAETTATDLTDINGIGPKFAEQLVAAGVGSIAALAAISDDKRAELADDIQGDDIDGWVEQAQAMVDGGAAAEEEE